MAIPLIAPIATILGSTFLGAAAAFAVRALIGIGLGFLVYKGLDTIAEWLLALTRDNLGKFPSDALKVMGLIRLDVGLSIIFGAYMFKVSKTAGKVALRAIR